MALRPGCTWFQSCSAGRRAEWLGFAQGSSTCHGSGSAWPSWPWRIPHAATTGMTPTVFAGRSAGADPRRGARATCLRRPAWRAGESGAELVLSGRSAPARWPNCCWLHGTLALQSGAGLGPCGARPPSDTTAVSADQAWHIARALPGALPSCWLSRICCASGKRRVEARSRVGEEACARQLAGDDCWFHPPPGAGTGEDLVGRRLHGYLIGRPSEWDRCTCSD